MSSSKNNEQVFEHQRLERILQIIEDRENAIKQQSSKLKQEVVEFRKNFWDDITINLEELDDVIETQESIKQQSNVLAQKERHYGKNFQRIKQLQRLKNQPYFGRVDFKEESDSEENQIYIGTSSLMDEDGSDFYIYDWRAPISSIYYDYAPGPVQYETEEDLVKGEMTLKRQYVIRQGKMKGIFDTAVTIVDELLQESLSQSANATMKSIVATIQQEQNKIIRHQGSKILVVQGAAGSGKTAAALQRIAYLLYHHRTSLQANQVLLLSPNDIFTSYISNVLPELGEEPVNQQTFYDFLVKGIESNLNVESPFEQMEQLLISEDKQQKENAVKYFTSMQFMKDIQSYLSFINNHGLQFRHIRFRNELFISKEEINAHFLELPKTMRLSNKIEKVQLWLLQKVKEFQAKEIAANWVQDQMELLKKEDYMKAYHEAEAEEEESSIQDEELILRKKIVHKAFAPLIKNIKQNRFVHTVRMYAELFNQWAPVGRENEWKAYSKYILHDLHQNKLPWEHAVAYRFFKGEIIGHDVDQPTRLIVIDEAQDYTPFQFAYLQHVYPYGTMTLLGDINQSIYSYATTDNPIQQEDSEDIERIVLTKSYRSTKPITDFTTFFAPSNDGIHAFDRQGPLPTVIQLPKSSKYKNVLQEIIEAKKKEGHETIAVICKSMQECEKYKELLEDEEEINLVRSNTKTYQKGVVFVPVYLAKGIEFDAVIVPEASEANYHSENERYLFYTACTRAMHDLTVVFMDKPSPFIKEIPKEKYSFRTILERN
ncbi:RNA polymerase recycling motor HelD [Oceanobacillus sp. 1P07AA]|uniref:RNA polymerase recycling motor HelD n=1 Tax=Oceanobacillus sp. 1P07AA TaxID=3132293 RepID=UPI0039A6A593